MVCNMSMILSFRPRGNERDRAQHALTLNDRGYGTPFRLRVSQRCYGASGRISNEFTLAGFQFHVENLLEHYHRTLRSRS